MAVSVESQHPRNELDKLKKCKNEYILENVCANGIRITGDRKWNRSTEFNFYLLCPRLLYIVNKTKCVSFSRIDCAFLSSVSPLGNTVKTLTSKGLQCVEKLGKETSVMNKKEKKEQSGRHR